MNGRETGPLPADKQEVKYLKGRLDGSTFPSRINGYGVFAVDSLFVWSKKLLDFPYRERLNVSARSTVDDKKVWLSLGEGNDYVGMLMPWKSLRMVRSCVFRTVGKSVIS